MLEELRCAQNKVVGLKQLLRALDKNEVEVVYLACDADNAIQGSVRAAADKAGVKIIFTDDMEELGKVCGIEVSAACAGIIPEYCGKEESSKG